MSTYSHDHSKRFRHTGAVVPLLRLAWRSDRNSSGGRKDWSQGSCLAVLVEQCGLYQLGSTSWLGHACRQH